jgi:hypothetical protein
MKFDNINNDNYVLYAAKNYDAPIVVLAEFEEDLNRVKYIKRLLSKYRTSGELNERLIINHLTILYNVFDQAATRILFLKIGEKYYSELKTFLIFLNRMPTIVTGIAGKDIISSDITLDMNVVEKLRKLIRSG